MREVTPEQIRTLISAESILSSFLLLYLSGHIQAWSQNIERYQFYSVTIFLSIILHVGCVFTLFISIILAFQSLHSENRDKRADLYHIAYDLFLAVLMLVSIGVFAGFISVVRQAIFLTPVMPLEIEVPNWFFLILFLFWLVYVLVLIVKPRWISILISSIRKLIEKWKD